MMNNLDSAIKGTTGKGVVVFGIENHLNKIGTSSLL